MYTGIQLCAADTLRAPFAPASWAICSSRSPASRASAARSEVAAYRRRLVGAAPVAVPGG